MSNPGSILDNVRKKVLGRSHTGSERGSPSSLDEQDQVTITVPEMGKQYWMPDSISKHCYDCGLSFTTIRRRHHCRICGQIFCSSCCQMIDARLLQMSPSKSEPGSKDNFVTASPNKSIRVCKYCHKSIVSSKLGQQQQQQQQQQQLQRRPSSAGGGSEVKVEDKRRKPTLTSLGDFALPNLAISTSSALDLGNTGSPNSAITPSSMTAASKWLFNSITSSLGVGSSGGSNTSRKLSSALSNTPSPASFKELSIEQSGALSRNSPALLDRKRSKTEKICDLEQSTIGSRRRYSIESKVVDNQAGESVSDSSLYDIRSKMAEMEKAFDANEPKWVREIFDQQADLGKASTRKDQNSSEAGSQLDQLNSSEDEDECKETSSSDGDNTEDEFKHSRKDYDSRSVDGSGYHLKYKLDKVGGPIVAYSTKVSNKTSQPKSENAASAPDSATESLVDSIQSGTFVLEPPSSPFSQSSTSSFFLHRLSATLSNSFESKDSDFTTSGSSAFTSSTLVASDRFASFVTTLDAIYERQTLAVARQVLADHRLSFDWLSTLYEMAKSISQFITLEQHAYLANVDNFYNIYQNGGDQNGQQQQQAQQAVDFLLNMVDSVAASDTPGRRTTQGHYPMDILQRVKIKAIPNGTQSECRIVHGLVFTKNVAHKRMRTKIENPKILLFACSIGYDERRRPLTTTTSTSAILKLTSFDSMIMQEASYISNLVAKIAAFKPDVILVQGSVSRTTLDLLHDYKITVVVNVKRSVLEKIALFTNTYLVHSPEMLLGSARLGKCDRFRLEEFVISPLSDDRSAPVMKKTLMFLEGCPRSIGCTVLLRGSTRYAVFRQLKQVLNLLIYIHYNARVEKAYHLASGVLPLLEQEWQNSGSLDELNKKVLGGGTRMRINSSRSSKSVAIGEDQNTSNATITSETKMTAIDDNSDPLRAPAVEKDEKTSNNQLGGNSLITLSAAIMAKKFENLLDRLPLSCSPGVHFSLPFLMEPDIYERSSMRAYFPTNLLISNRLTKELKATAVSQYLQSSNEEEEEEETLAERPDNNDDDYANFAYLVNREREKKESDPAGEDGKWLKLWRLQNHLAMRSMVIKQHPMLINCDYDFRRQSRTYLADFRANGPQKRYIPDIFPRHNAKPVASSKRESLSVERQQSVSVLFSVFPFLSSQRTMTAAGAYCFQPRLMNIVYYGANDMSLGAFLFRHFFFARTRFNQSMARNETGEMIASAAAGQFTKDDATSRAASPEFGNSTAKMPAGGGGTASRKVWCANEKCTQSMYRHMMRFTHHRGTVTVKFTKVSRSDVTGSGNNPSVATLTRMNKVLTWSCCSLCQQRSSYEEMTSDALALSFGKFLELKFYGDVYHHQQWYFQANACRHPWHRSACQFFFFDQLVAIFQYEPIRVNEVNLPAPIIPVTRNHFSRGELINLAQQMTLKISELYTRIEEELLAIRSVAVNKINQQPQPTIDQQQQTTTKLEACYFDAQDIRLLDELNRLAKVELEDLRQGIKSIHLFLTSPDLSKTPVVELFRLRNMITFFIKSLVSAAANWTTKFNDYASFKRKNPDNRLLTPFAETSFGIALSRNMSSSKDTLDTISSAEDYDVDETDLGEENEDQNTSGEDVTDQRALMNNLKTKLSTIISQVVNRVMPNTNNNKQAGAHLLLSEGGSFSEANNSSATLTASTSALANLLNLGPSSSKLLGTANNEEVQYINLEVNFDDLNSSTVNAASVTANATAEPAGIKMFEHYHLPMYRDIAIVVKDRDLGSMIAYALTTPEYERRLAELGGTQHETLVINKDSPNKSMDAASGENKQADGDHISIEYKDAWGKFFCQIYFAEPFRRFRSLILTDGGDSNRESIRNSVASDSNHSLSSGAALAEELYIFSLASSSPWNALGGKSGSTFSKTANERFILKEVSKGELNHFLTFVSDYLAYCERAMMGKHPSALVKVVGVYQMTYKNTVTNKTGKHYILVMENLFYECSVTCIYDLKGSVRNRKVEMPVPQSMQQPTVENRVHQSSESNESGALGNVVLLDGNLRQISTTCPLYVHQHSKLLLIEAIFRDSEFLRLHGVMDYSLLVGHDELHSEFVVGIIDYVRLFNWEKILESRVKKIGNALDPTIVHPMNYQKRFIEAIYDYFTDVPDKWCNCLRLVGHNIGQTRLHDATDDGERAEDDESSFVVI